MDGRNMKRVLENSHESVPANAEVRAKLRHEYLSQDYQDLQKEFASKMKDLQEAKEKKQTLLNEVHFLRARYQYLMELQSRGTRTKEVLGKENTGIEEWNNSAAKAATEQSFPMLERGSEEHKVAEGMEKAKQRRPGKHDKSVKRKKVWWQDPVATNP